ncbi:hypothetical protein Acj9p031 [Acinetobacter phage Acj9]|uniref:Uncharacterized protein n=1 Tax=Acinetobacter phage Acj9 TaxID=760939 RepID=E5EPG5_9CAUD|nr:hypothetical protein Acj9p031 [Acinetobacter phage Acj9]ADG59931.1 hypothetical protein Acj9p031 [Acinetobacter phage Acj9]
MTQTSNYEIALKRKIDALKLSTHDIWVQRKRNEKQRRALLRYRESHHAKNRIAALDSRDALLLRQVMNLQDEIKNAGDTICRLREIRRGNSKRTVESVLSQFTLF